MRIIHRPSIPRCGLLLILALSASGLPSGAAEAAVSVPPGAAEFAGKLVRNHAYLVSDRQALEGINRRLRASQQRARQAVAEPARTAALEAASLAVGQLLGQVKSSPSLLHVALTSGQPELSPTGPLRLPGDTGALLFEIQAGGEGTHFSTGFTDLSQPPGESSLVVIEAGATGTTYALNGLDHVPRGRTSLVLEFRRPGQPSLRAPLDVEVPAPGRLKLTVLSDDTGEPAPAMVRLMWRMDGEVRQPANGIEFAPQFDKQGMPTGARAANLPGAQQGPFWCVPGPFDMTLAPGTWQIAVRRGVEHEVLVEEVTLRSNQTVEKALRPKRWADMRRKGWWSGDDHVHARITSDQDARHLMAWIQAEDVHLANIVKMGDIYRTYFEQRGFGRDYRVAQGEYVLVPGQECPRTHDQIGHVLALNINAMVRDTDHYFLYDEVFDAVRAQGGLSGYAHVNNGNFHVHRDMSINVPRQKVDFAEILQFNLLGTDLYYEFLNLGCKLTASAGSDVPWGGTVGEVRAYAFLGEQPFSADAWFEAFRRGRTFTTSGPMIEFQVDDALPGDEIRVTQDRPLRIRARAWGDPRRMAPIQLEIVRHGEVIGHAESSDPARPDVSLELNSQSGYGCWIAARARAGDGTSAHTTPVYVVREGFRFWKYDALNDLIGQRLKSLSEIEEIINQARSLQAEGKLGTDRYRLQLALEGNALMERVTAARRLYQQLKETAETERERRGAP
jgi:hypothetical protein